MDVRVAFDFGKRSNSETRSPAFGRRGSDEPQPTPTRTTPTAAASVIGPGVSVTGEIVDKGVLKLYGDIQGNVVCRTLTVGESGSIDGDIKADSVSISGACTGNIDARVLSINKTARVDGKVVVHESLSVQPPARFEGRCRRGRPAKGGATADSSTQVFDQVRETLADVPPAPSPKPAD